MRPTTDRTLQTIAEAYRQMCEGEEPWIALGDFRNAWCGHAKDRRVDWCVNRSGKPAQDTEFANRWGAFCAATVEFLCERYAIPCPPWVHDPGYTLQTPWWHTERADDPKILKRLIQTTPEAFARRKIFCGDRLYQNKYEMSAWVQEAGLKG